MNLLAFLITFASAGALNILTLQLKSPNERSVILTIYYVLLFVAGQILLSQVLGSKWHPFLQIGAFNYILLFWMRQIWISGFWGKLFNQSLLIVHLFVGGYLYAITQMPYNNQPFKEISFNAPLPLKISDFGLHQIAGLPDNTTPASRSETKAKHPEPNSNTAKSSSFQTYNALSWNNLDALFKKDSHIRNILHQLKEEQERGLSEELTRLNTASSYSTQMRRNALSQAQATDLLNNKAISSARFQTLMETWRLLAQDENDFRERQAETRFYALLNLLEDNNVDESNKVEFIRFMSQHFGDDVRLVKPLVRLYARLDDDYPRQKRLNQVFMNLYLAKREALIDAFKSIGKPALQPLLDFRGMSVSQITYSQARLDLFLQDFYGVNFRPLYSMMPQLFIPNFLNRQKYPLLNKLSGASFSEETSRRTLVEMAYENITPTHQVPLLSIDKQLYQDMIDTLPAHRLNYSLKLDNWIIHPDPAVRANLAWRLAYLKSPYYLPLLLDLMKDSSPDVRRYAAIGVGNFQILDAQSANDPKFMEIIRMLQNYRSNSDSFARGWAVLALAGTGDPQKALYAVDLILNDGADSNSLIGATATTWRSEEERLVLQNWQHTLQQTAEDPWVKTQALNTLIALDSPESLDILLNYLHHIYAVKKIQPSFWRYIVPHMTLPQEAENAEDVVWFLSQKHKLSNKQPLKALRLGLSRSYEQRNAGEFFQILNFLRLFDNEEYQQYLTQNVEPIRIMQIWEYTEATYGFWLACWPISLLCVLMINYNFMPLLSIRLPGQNTHYRPNQRANPAADSRHKMPPPSPAIVPIKINKSGK